MPRLISVLCLLLLLAGCLKSEFSQEVDRDMLISYEDCPFFGFLADTLWCADDFDIRYFEEFGENTITISALKKYTYQVYPYRKVEHFFFLIDNFSGVGTYSFDLTSDLTKEYFAFSITNYDVVDTYYNLLNPEKGDFGEIIISYYDESNGVIEGEVRGQISQNATTHLVLRGGRFREILD